MKYLFAINTMNVGGAETGLVELMNELVVDNEVDLFLTYKTGPLLKKINPNINIISYVDKDRPFYSFMGLLYFTLTLFGSGLGYRQRIRNDYDVEISYLEGFPALMISRSNKETTKIASIRVELDKHKTILDLLPWGKRMQNKMYTAFDGIHCVSKATQISFNNRYIDSKEKSYVITTGFDIKKIKKSSVGLYSFPNNSSLNVLSIGRMETQKGYDKIFDALNLMKSSSKITYHIVGNAETKYANELKKKYSNLLESKRIILHGQKSNPYVYMNNADLIVSTSNKEGFPRVVNESLVLGKKVAATDIPSNNEALHGGEFGTLFENSVDGLVDLLERFEENQDTVSHAKVEVKDLQQFRDEFVDKIISIKGDKS